MEDTVWVSNIINDISVYKRCDSDMTLKDIHTVIDIGRRDKAGEPLPIEVFAKKIWPGEYVKRPIKRLRPFFNEGSFWVCNEKVTNVLRQFDLGEGNLYPVEIYQKDKITRVDGVFHYLNFGNVKHTFLPEQSPRTKDGIPNKKKLPSVTNDGDVAVSPDALSGPDIWVEPEMFKAFFMSGRLVEALQKAKVDKYFALSQCKIVEGV